MSDATMHNAPGTLRITVVYALPTQQPLVELRLPAGTTVQQAVERSGLRERFVELQQEPLNCAIYSRVVALSTVLNDGDRVEILRPLLIDPKESRRRAAKAERRKN
jgi:putative ubiquitin-RnfH superfamily antitoxin RatB of RatAB toxin-antitoxin module